MTKRQIEQLVAARGDHKVSEVSVVFDRSPGASEPGEWEAGINITSYANTLSEAKARLLQLLAINQDPAEP